MQIYFKLLILAFYLTIYLQIKYGIKLTLNMEVVAYNTLVLACKHATFIKNNII